MAKEYTSTELGKRLTGIMFEVLVIKSVICWVRFQLEKDIRKNLFTYFPSKPSRIRKKEISKRNFDRGKLL